MAYQNQYFRELLDSSRTRNPDRKRDSRWTLTPRYGEYIGPGGRLLQHHVGLETNL